VERTVIKVYDKYSSPFRVPKEQDKEQCGGSEELKNKVKLQLEEEEALSKITADLGTEK